MSKRSHLHLTDLSCIACEDLTEFGAGKEGWLAPDASTTILCALDAHSLAIANRSLILILGWSDPDEPRVKIRPELSPIEAEHITAIEWLVFEEMKVIAVGTSRGFLLVYSLRGDLIHRQMVHTGRILKLRVHGAKKDLMQDILSEEVCVVIPGVIARFDGTDIQSLLQRWFQETHSRFWDQKPKKDSEDMGNSYGRLPYQLWNVNKYGSCVDAAITGIMPPPLMELQEKLVLLVQFSLLAPYASFIVGQSSQRYYCAVTIGDDAVISAFRLSEDRNRSLVGAILSKVVPATFSTIASFSKMIWRSEQTSNRKSEEKPQSFARASPLTCLKDHPRKGEKLTLSPSGTLAAITDSLGRILLLDIQALVVVRLWKGYRDANCFFMEMLVNRDAIGSSSSYYEPRKSDYCLCLAIHAPRKGIIEVWQMRTGPRLLTVQCAKGCRLLQPTYRFGSSLDSPYVPLEVFLLNGDSGQLSVLNRFLN
ncbi:rab3 GTPase-activating protein non-catalytic subunit isoform X1 [Durio zibethinus]|uniref:Rab3 GTPase-activating protein non-catalytic subunit isoform X1 n=1 Tax=Durio zibethinus TaxID=66656 RepID=A0A6P5ZA68_DURZI|nr:rab3 GTPase-activating protein non-catalytic subunit isoform X1 [Durio zibethinus]